MAALTDRHVNIYVEFLLNISQATIYVDLNLAGQKDDKAYLASDRKRIEISYAGETSAVTFPTGISGKATVHLPLKAAAQLSLRLEITEEGEPNWSHGLEVLNDSPWNAYSFEIETLVACRSCGATLTTDNCASRVWKDLPRDDWAETMDLWHCHKPTTTNNEFPLDKGEAYSAASRPIVELGCAFVDACDIYLDPGDCQNLQITGPDTKEVRCDCCAAVLGVSDNRVGGIRLHKWNLQVKRSPSLEWEQNDVQSLVCVQLLELIESQAARRIVIRSSNDAKDCDAILMWVLNPDLKYCASYVNDGRPQRAMKVLHKPYATASLQEQGEIPSETSIVLPDVVLGQLHADLLQSTDMMPERARKLQGWTVSLLNRFGSTSNKTGR